jgi:nitric oxide reductase subunit C
MWKLLVFSILASAYILYSGLVYTTGTSSSIQLTADDQRQVDQGRLLFQQNNCIACHQLYGLGGYLGPDLTNAYSDSLRGDNYIRAFLQAGGRRMPNFHFSTEQVNAISHFLRYVDKSSATPN